MAQRGINFASLLYQPIFDRLGVDAKLILAGGTFEIVALDKTIGVALPEQNGIALETLTPQAELMVRDMTRQGITFDQLDSQQIVLFPPGSDTSVLSNGKSWNIISHKLNPSSSGIADGTVYLQLEGDSDD